MEIQVFPQPVHQLLLPLRSPYMTQLRPAQQFFEAMFRELRTTAIPAKLGHIENVCVSCVI